MIKAVSRNSSFIYVFLKSCGITIRIWNRLKSAGKEWVKHNPLLLGAAISFYVILSMGPILAVIIIFLSEIIGRKAAQGEIVKEIQMIVGEKAGQIIESVIQKASASSGKRIAVISSIPLLFFGTTMVFFQIRNALNIIWEIKEEDTGLKGKIKNYSISFIMLFIIGFFFVMIILKNPVIILFRDQINDLIFFPAILFDLINILVTYGLIILIFAAVYKILAKAYLAPKAIWNGAAVTSLFFTIIQFLVGINAQNSHIDSALGAIGSFTILFLWIFYSSLIFLYGASYTKVYSLNMNKGKR